MVGLWRGCGASECEGKSCFVRSFLCGQDSISFGDLPNRTRYNVTMSHRRTLLTALAVSMGGFLFGFDASVISGVIRFIKPEFGLSDLELGWVVSSPAFSAMFAMLVAGALSDALGRKRVLVIVAFLYAISAILSAIAPTTLVLVVARMLGGVAFGAALILAPMYIAEISPAEQRGRLVSVQQLNIVLGFSAAYFSNYYLLQAIGDSGWITEATAWRWMLGIEAIPALIYFGVAFFIPFSPRWLMMKGRVEEAEAVLVWLHGPERASQEAALIKGRLDDSIQERTEYKELLARGMRFVLAVGLLVGVLQQITGVNAIYFYATTIFEQSGVGADASFAQAVWVGIINVLFTILAMALIDRLGRKPLLLIGLLGVMLSMGITSYGFNQATYEWPSEHALTLEGIHPDAVSDVTDRVFESDKVFKKAVLGALGKEQYRIHESAIIEASASMNARLILAGILGFVTSFAFSLGPVMWVMLSELFPNRVRALAISAIGFVNSAVSWFVQFVFPWELTNLGNAITYLIYGLFALVGLIILWRILPETKGKSLEQIENEFVG